MRVKKDLFERGSFVVGNGQSTRFWEDKWLGETPLADQYASLHTIVQRRNDLVTDVLANNPLNIEFRREPTWTAWLHLVQRLMFVNLNTEEDNFVRKLTTSGVFSV